MRRRDAFKGIGAFFGGAAILPLSAKKPYIKDRIKSIQIFDDHSSTYGCTKSQIEERYKYAIVRWESGLCKIHRVSRQEYMDGIQMSKFVEIRRLCERRKHRVQSEDELTPPELDEHVIQE